MKKNFKLIVLFPVGRSGSMFLHNLFDSHPNILTIPVAFQFYFLWEKFHFTKQNSIRKLVCHFLNETNLQHLFLENCNEMYKYTDEKGNTCCLKLNYNELEELLIKYVIKCSGGKYPNRKQFLICIHFTIAELMGVSIKEKTHILLHEHNPYMNSIMEEDSWEELKTLVTIRDPRNSFASYVQLYKEKPQFEYIRALYISFIQMKHSIINGNILLKKANNSLLFVKTEYLNSTPNEVVNKICTFIGIDMLPICMSPTFFAHNKKGISKFNKNQIGFDKSGLKKSVYLEVLTKSEISFIEYVFSDVFLHYDINVSPNEFSLLKLDLVWIEKRFKNKLYIVFYLILLGPLWKRFFIVYFVIFSRINFYTEIGQSTFSISKRKFINYMVLFLRRIRVVIK
jgi:hypothetical protein